MEWLLLTSCWPPVGAVRNVLLATTVGDYKRGNECVTISPAVRKSVIKSSKEEFSHETDRFTILDSIHSRSRGRSNHEIIAVTG
jgi:hypothetical protein